jgi:hypothetical protein
MEYNAIQLLIRLLEEDKAPAAPGFTLHVAHLSDSGAVPMIQAAKKKGMSSVSSCFALCSGNLVISTAEPVLLREGAEP